MNLENVVSVTINTDEDFFHTIGYNGSWHVIEHNTTDEIDYSISMYEMWYEAEELGCDFQMFINDHFSQWFPHIEINYVEYKKN